MKQVLVLVVVASLVLAVAAKNLDFALEYRGQCSYSNNNGFCRLKAQSQEILTKIKYVHSIFFFFFKTSASFFGNQAID